MLFKRKKNEPKSTSVTVTVFKTESAQPVYREKNKAVSRETQKLLQK